MKTFTLAILLIALSFTGFSTGGWEISFEETEQNKSELKIYPNPCKTGKVTVEYPSKEILEIRLNNITGKQVLLKTYPPHTHKAQVLLHEIPNGLYLIQVKTQDAKPLVKKLLVSKN